MTNSANPHPKPIPVIDNPAATEVYANKIVGLSFDSGAIHLILGVQRLTPNRIEHVVDPKSPPPPPAPTVPIVARLVLSPPLCMELVNGISGLMNAVQMAQAQAMLQQKQQAGMVQPGSKVAN
jgi:hypothetical protein